MTDAHTSSDRAVPPPPTPSPVRRLIRRRDDRVIAGVASGVADYLHIDPLLVRIAFVILALSGGVGLVAYLAAWLLMPEATADRERPTEVRRDEPRFWLGVALIVIAAALVADELWRPGIVWPLALIGIGLLLFRRPSETDPGDRPNLAMPTSGDPPDTATPSRAPGSEVAGSTAPPNHVPPQPTTGAGSQPPPPRPPRSVLGRATVAVGLMAGGVAALLDTAGVLGFSFEQYLAFALVVVGVGLLVGAWWGRSTMLIVLGALIVPALLATKLIDVPLQGDVGERRFQPGAWDELRPEYELGAGELTLDLTRLDPARTMTEVEARVGVGEIHVIVPPDVSARVEARAGAGGVDLFGSEREGLGLEIVREVGPGPPQLRILLEVGTGEISVRSSSP